MMNNKYNQSNSFGDKDLDTVYQGHAFKSDKIPSGMMVISSDGIKQGGQRDSSDHPIIKLINKEHKRICDEARKS